MIARRVLYTRSALDNSQETITSVRLSTLTQINTFMYLYTDIPSGIVD